MTEQLERIYNSIQEKKKQEIQETLNKNILMDEIVMSNRNKYFEYNRLAEFYGLSGGGSVTSKYIDDYVDNYVM